MRAAPIIAFASLFASQTSAATEAEVFVAMIDFVETECPEAFAAHRKQWPDASKSLNVVWQNPNILNSKRESRVALPLDLATAKVMASHAAHYGLIEDLVAVRAFALRDVPPEEDWVPRYRNKAESLEAAVDLFECLRPSEEEIAAAAPRPERVTEIEAELRGGDCRARLGRKMAAAFSGSDASEIYAVLKPLSAAFYDCGSEG